MPLEYKDASFFGRRSYQIAEGMLLAKGNNVGKARFEVKIEIASLDPNYDRLWLQSPLFFPMCIVALVGIAGSMVLGEFSPTAGISWVHGLCLTLGFTGILFSLLSLRRIPVARFKNISGVPVLDIFEAGPQKKAFGEFIGELQARIREAKKS